jgi:hypothetical protein
VGWTWPVASAGWPSPREVCQQLGNMPIGKDSAEIQGTPPTGRKLQGLRRLQPLGNRRARRCLSTREAQSQQGLALENGGPLSLQGNTPCPRKHGMIRIPFPIGDAALRCIAAPETFTARCVRGSPRPHDYPPCHAAPHPPPDRSSAFSRSPTFLACRMAAARLINPQPSQADSAANPAQGPSHFSAPRTEEGHMLVPTHNDATAPHLVDASPP